MSNHHVAVHCLYCGHNYCARCMGQEQKPQPDHLIRAIYVIGSRPVDAKCPKCKTQTSILI